MRNTTSFVLLAATIVAAGAFALHWRQPAAEAAREPAIARGALLQELTDMTDALGGEPARYRADTPRRGFDAVQIGREMSGDPVIAQVVYQEKGGTRAARAVTLVSERLVLRVTENGDCANTAGRPLALCETLSRGEWRQVFLQVASFARMACVAPGKQDCAPG